MGIWLTVSLGYFCYKLETNTFNTLLLKNASIHTTHPSATCQTFPFYLQLPKEDLMELDCNLFVVVPQQFRCNTLIVLIISSLF